MTVCVLLKEGDLGRDVHLKLRTANGSAIGTYVHVLEWHCIYFTLSVKDNVIGSSTQLSQ